LESQDLIGALFYLCNNNAQAFAGYYPLDITPWHGCKKRANAVKCGVAEMTMAHDILSQIIERVAKWDADMSDGKRILIVDDDDILTEMLSEQLSALEGFQCVCAHTGEAGLELAKNSYFDLVILDVELPGISGRETCRLLRAGGLAAPIIMLTAWASDSDAIRGLNAGATDYVAKPFKLGVLLARIRAHIRQFEQSDDAMLAIGPFSFYPGSKLLTTNQTDGAKPIRLTDKEAQILKYLYLHGGRVVGRDELLDEVWSYNADVTTHTLETHVYRLRQKMEADPSHAELIITEPGGYRLAP